MLLETEWVLRSFYSWPGPVIAQALRLLLDLPGLQEIPPYAVWAIERLEAGAQFSDMMHVATAAHCASSFATFDGDIQKKAVAPPVPIETLG